MGLRYVLGKFRQHLLDIALSRQHEDELKLGDFDVYGIVVFTEKDANVVSQNLWTPL